MLRETPNNESIIVEYGFADSTGDDVNQIKNNWQGLAEAVVKALAGYIGVPYKLPNGQESNYYIVKAGDKIFMGNYDKFKKTFNLWYNLIGKLLLIEKREENEY